MEEKVCPYCKRLRSCEVKKTGGMNYVWECSEGHQFERPTYGKIFSGSIIGLAVGLATGGMFGDGHHDGQTDYQSDYHGNDNYQDPMDG